MRHAEVLKSHLENKIEKLKEYKNHSYENRMMFHRLHEKWKDETYEADKQISQLEKELYEVNRYLEEHNEGRQMTLFDFLNEIR